MRLRRFGRIALGDRDPPFIGFAGLVASRSARPPAKPPLSPSSSSEIAIHLSSASPVWSHGALLARQTTAVPSNRVPYSLGRH